MKLFNLIATSILGAAMAIGVGVSVANSDRGMMKTSAAVGDKVSFVYTTSSSKKLSTTYGANTLADDSISGLSVSCTTAKTSGSGVIQNSYNTTFGGQQMTTNANNNTTVTFTFGNPWSGTHATYKSYTQINSVTFTAVAGASTTYNVTCTIDGVDATGDNDGFSATKTTTTFTPATGHKKGVIVITVSYVSGSKGWYFDNLGINAEVPNNSGYTITPIVTNGTYSGDTSIEAGGTASVTISPNSGYKLPTNVSVTGATSEYNSTTGVISLSNPTGNVSISATMDVASQYSISTSLTGLTATGDTQMYENGVGTVTLAVVDSSTKTLPASITVTNAVDYDYNSSTGVVTINGATGNVVITAAAIDKPAEATENFSTASAWTTVTTNEEYSTTNDLITATWKKGTSSNNAGAYWNPGRFYKNHVLVISATTGAGAVTTIKSIEFTCSSGSSGSPAVNYSDALYSSTVTVTKPTSSPGSVSASKNNLVITHTMTGTVTEIQIVLANQSRIPSFSVTYEKDQSEVNLQSVSATYEGVLVSQQVSPVVTFNPAGASNKDLTYTIKSGSQYAEVDADTGVVTGIGAGTATITITPDDTHASPIDVNVVVSALPSISTVTVGKKYAVTASLSDTNFELTGIASTSSYDYGSSTNFTDNPSNAFPVKVVNGLYSHTVALEVEISSSTKYLSFDKTNTNNHLTVVDSIDRSACWIFAEEDSKLVIRNVDSYARKLGSTVASSVGRFACYQNLSDSVITPTFVEIPESKTDKEYVQDFVDLYLYMDEYNENKGWCKDGAHSYYLTAKAGLNAMTAAQINIFKTDADFSAAKARYERWAEFNNDAAPYDGNDEVVTTLHSNPMIANKVSNTIVVVVVVSSILAIASVGAYFMLRRKRYIK